MASTTELSADISSETELCNEISNSSDPSSNELTDQLLDPSFRKHLISGLKSIISKVENLQNPPSIHIYSITAGRRKNLSAIDVSQNLSHLAYSFPHSNEIHFFARKSLLSDIASNDFSTTWKNFKSARSQVTKDGENVDSESLSSPQEFIIRHDDVSGLRFSLNDNLLLSCSLDGSIKAISTTTYSILEHYDGFGSAKDIDINRASTQFATANFHSLNALHVAYLYDFERKTAVQNFSGHENSLKCVRFHPNGLYIATASSDKTIKLWSVQQSKEVRCFRDDGMHPEKIIFSPDGKCIASTHGGSVKIWDLSSGKKLKSLETSNLETDTLNVCYNLDGSILAAGGSDKKINIWNIVSDGNTEMAHYNLLKSEHIGKTIFSLKYVANFISCVTF